MPAVPSAPRIHKYYVYILECADNSYYVGVTSNIDRRMAEHQNAVDQKSYTARRLPVELVHLEIFKYIEDAIERETKLKKWSHSKKEALIRGDFNTLRSASKKKHWNKGNKCQAE